MDEIFSIIGCGRVGRCLALQLTDSGYSISDLVDLRRNRAEALQTECGGRVTDRLKAVDSQTTFILIAVPDEAVPEVGRRLAEIDGLSDALCVVHTSGLLGSEALGDLRARQVPVASCHPAFSFTQTPPSSLAEVPFAIEGDDIAGKRSEAWVKRLGGIPWTIRREDKIHYHAACAMASNYLTVLMRQVESLMDFPGAAGLQTLMPLIKGTLHNIGSVGPEKALTGAIRRGDVLTVRTHLEALAELGGEMLPIYIHLGRGALHMAASQGLDAQRVSQIEKALNAFE